ncbi:unnamed protein product, partial [Clonostachys solani]
NERLLTISLAGNVYVYAESVGKTELLCNQDGDFMRGYQQCLQCLVENNLDGKVDSEVVIEFKEFLDFCKIPLGYVFTTGAFVLPGPMTSTMVYLVVPSGQRISTPASTPATTRISTNTSPSIQSSSATTSSLSTGAPTDTGASINKSTLAGIIAGSLGGLIVIMIAVLIIWRRTRAQNNTSTDCGDSGDKHFEKAQLHSDCVPKPVFEASDGMIHEIEGSALPPESVVEKPANEAPAQELPPEGLSEKPANETPARDFIGSREQFAELDSTNPENESSKVLGRQSPISTLKAGTRA